MEKLKNALSSTNYINVVLVLLGIRAIIDANFAQALIVACFSGMYSYSKYLESKKIPNVPEEIKKEISDLRNNVSGLMLRNATKPQEMEQQIKRFF